MNSTGRFSQLVFGTTAGVLMVACGAGPGLSRYMVGLKPVLNALPDICVVVLGIVVICIPRLRNFKRTSAWTIAWVFMTWVVLVSIPSIAALTWQGVYGLRTMAWGLVIAVLMQTMVLSLKTRNYIRVLLLIVLLANMLVALVQSVVGLSAAELQGLIEAGASYQVESQTRLLGLQATGQEMSMLAGSAFVWACATIVSRGFRNAGVLVWLLGLSSAVVTLVVLQRSALIGALVALGILVISIGAGSLKARRAASSRRLATVGGASMLAIVVLAVLAPERVDLALARFQTLFGLSSDYSFSVRQETTLPVALRLLADQPFGYGLGASGPVAAKFAPSGPLAEYPLGGIAADNGYIFVALQIGILGAILFVLMLVLWAWRGSFIDLTPQDRLAPRAVVCFLAAIMISGSFWGLTGPMAMVTMLASLGSWPSNARPGSLSNAAVFPPESLKNLP